MKLPSHDRALAAALRLDALARTERVKERAFRSLGPPFDPSHPERHAQLLEEVAEWVHWLAGHAPRLRELETPLHKPNHYGGRR